MKMLSPRSIRFLIVMGKTVVRSRPCGFRSAYQDGEPDFGRRRNDWCLRVHAVRAEIWPGFADRFEIRQQRSRGKLGAFESGSTRIIEGNFDPGFFVEHFVKDLNIAFRRSESHGLEASRTRACPRALR